MTLKELFFREIPQTSKRAIGSLFNLGTAHHHQNAPNLCWDGCDEEELSVPPLYDDPLY
jgi:hypothetical protein